MKTKKILSFIFISISLLSLTSCGNDKKVETKNNKTNISSENKNIKKVDENRIQKIKPGEKVETIKSEIGKKELKDINISPNGAGTVEGGLKTGANPLDL